MNHEQIDAALRKIIDAQVQVNAAKEEMRNAVLEFCGNKKGLEEEYLFVSQKDQKVLFKAFVSIPDVDDIEDCHAKSQEAEAEVDIDLNPQAIYSDCTVVILP